MKKYILIACAVIVWSACSNKSKGGKVALKTQKDSFAYAFGVTFGSLLKNSNIKEVDWDIFKSATEFVLKNGDSSAQLNRETIDKVINTYMAEAKFGENKKKGEDYIAQRKKESGFKTTPSGLMYKELRKGNGIKPTITDTVLVMYTGKFTDGKTFDSNVGGKPMKMTLNGGAIPGFLEAMQLMEVGSKVETVIPYQIAYGAKGMKNPYTGETMMEPYKTLIFELEIIGIQK